VGPPWRCPEGHHRARSGATVNECRNAIAERFAPQPRYRGSLRSARCPR
jgi:hypothetical protein